MRIWLCAVACFAVPLHALGADPVLQIGHSGHSGGVGAVAISADGKYALTGSADGTAILWETTSGRVQRRFSGFAVAFASDGKRLFTGLFGRAWVCDRITGKEIVSFHDESGRFLAMSQNGKWVVSGTSDGVADLWDADSGTKVRSLTGHVGRIKAAAFSPDGQFLLIASHDKTAVLWETATGKNLQRFRRGEDSFVASVGFSPDGQLVVTRFEDGTVMLWSRTTGKPVVSLEGQHSAATFTPDGQHLVDGFTVLNSATGKKLRNWDEKLDTSATAVSADGTTVVTASEKSAVLWDFKTGNKIRTLAGHGRSLTALTTAGDVLVIGLADGSVALSWRMDRGEPGKCFQVGVRVEEYVSVALSADGSRLVAGTSDCAVLWDMKTGEVSKFLLNAMGLGSVALSSDGIHALTSDTGGGSLTGDTGGSLWEATTGKRLHTFDGKLSSALAFSPDGKRAFTGRIDCWDIATRTRLQRFDVEKGTVAEIAVSPSGKMLFAVVDDKLIAWEIATGQRIRCFEGHKGITAVASSPDGKQVLTGGTIAILWDSFDGSKLHTLSGHESFVVSVAFRSDGKQLLTGAADGCTRLWDATTGQCLAALYSLDAGKDWLVVTPDGYFDGSEGSRRLVAYRVNGDIVPGDKLAKEYYRPGLLAVVWRGEKVK